MHASTRRNTRTVKNFVITLDQIIVVLAKLAMKIKLNKTFRFYCSEVESNQERHIKNCIAEVLKG